MIEKLFATPRASSRNLENLAEGLDFLNIRNPGERLSQNFSGSRILRNPSPTLTLREGFLNSGTTTGESAA